LVLDAGFNAGVLELPLQLHIFLASVPAW
jgi:hypothetical protein